MNTIYKPRFSVFSTVSAILLIAAINFTYISLSIAAGNKAEAKKRTALVIANSTNSEKVFGVELAALGNGCGPDNPPVTADQLASLGFCSDVVNSDTPPYAGKCMLTLSPRSYTTFPNISNTCISGSLTFGGFPGCPNSEHPNGYTTAEFTFNSNEGLETVNISLLYGYNARMTISMYGGKDWLYGSRPAKPITKISSKLLGENIGNPGVVPKGCNDCVQLIGGILCPDFSLNPECQNSRICEVYRDAANSGGTVTVSFVNELIRY